VKALDDPSAAAHAKRKKRRMGFTESILLFIHDKDATATATPLKPQHRP